MNVSPQMFTKEEQNKLQKTGVYKMAKFAQRMIMLSVGAAMMAVALEIFLVPNQMIDGGITRFHYFITFI